MLFNAGICRDFNWFQSQGCLGSASRLWGSVHDLASFVFFYKASETSEDLICEYGSEALQGLVSGFWV